MYGQPRINTMNMSLALETRLAPLPERIAPLHKNPCFSLYDGAEKRLNSAMGIIQDIVGTKTSIAPTSAMAIPISFEDLLVTVGESRDRDAFIRIFEYFAPRVKSFLMKGGLTPEQADELAQETLLTVWHRADSYDPKQSAASTWIFTIARNKKIDALRRKAPYAQDINDAIIADTHHVAADTALSQTEEARAIAAAISTLPDDQADLIKLAYFEDKTHQDIATETGLPLGTVKSRIRLAMDRLRHNLRGFER